MGERADDSLSGPAGAEPPGTGAGRDTPGVIAPPPLVYLASVLLGVGLDRLRPAPVFPPALETPLGAALILVALGLVALCVREFRAARTPLPPYEPTRAIVRSGPYRFSRNPIYLAFTFLHLGLAIWVNSAWLLLTLAITLVVMHAGVIAREERYLARKFGAEYESYRSAVRRWL
jgi:protein-S-isoprenylcysteine O-methyltransferase Ste14